METRLNEVDSRVLARPVLDLLDLTSEDDIAAAEKAYVDRYHPAYVLCKVQIEDLTLIHQMEEAGFRFVETQLRLTFRLSKPFDVPEGPYLFERVVRRDALEDVLAIVRETFTDDRWLIDPWFTDARGLSGKRYEAYVRQSFERPDERVYRLLERQSGRTLAMRTHRHLGNGGALMLLGGVHPDYKCAGLAPLMSFHEYNELLRQGITQITTHVSARNYAILNLEMSALKYRVVQTFVVLRKVYST
ncbi:MAG TPA: hypothetical protein VLC46_11050 [Thermoanaerobaculia bacterium]|jgi:hypothetical protein|nr:hypothetical protein [Thermoanaerobaculia bacterium]